MSGENEAVAGTAEQQQAAATAIAEPKKTRQRRAVQGESMTVEQPAEPQTPNALIAIAVQQDLDIDKLEKLLQLQREWEKENARKAFHVALSKFQSEIPPIVREDAGVVRGGSRKKYASLGTINEAIRPWLYANGLSYRWTPEALPDGTIRVTCTVSHSLGHSESATLCNPPIEMEKSTPIQRLAACITYLERYTLVCALGLSTVDEDDDGAGTTKADEPALTPDQVRAKQLEMARAAAGATDTVAAHQAAPQAASQPAVQTPAAQVASPAAAPAPQQQPAETQQSQPKTMPRISEEQSRQVMGLCKELFPDGKAAFAWIANAARITTQAEFAGISEGVALALLADLNHMKHVKLKATADANLQASQSAPGTVTAEQRTELRDLSVQFFDGNADSAAAQTVNWLRRIGLSTPRELSFNQAAGRITELKAEIENDRLKKAKEPKPPF